MFSGEIRSSKGQGIYYLLGWVLPVKSIEWFLHIIATCLQLNFKKCIT